jgi:O-antigen/teichoic acid export membrane protein
LSQPAAHRQKPWRQLVFVLGEAALTLLSGTVLFVIISRVGGAALLGTYALAIAWLALFQGVSSFGIPEFLVREVGTRGSDAAGQVFHASLLGLVSGVTAMLLMVGGSRLLGYSSDLVELVAVASLALIPGFLNTVCRSVFLALRRMHFVFLAVLVEVTIVMSASLYLLSSGYGALALVAALVVAKVVSAALSNILLYRHVLRIPASFDPVLLRRTAITVFTFGIGNMLGMLTMRINTILVSAWVDAAALGQFAAATKIMEIGLIAPSLFAQLLMSRIAYGFNTQGDRDPNRFGPWYEVLFALVVPFCVGVWVFAGPMLRILFGTGFEDAVWVLRTLMIFLLIETVAAVMSVILLAAQRQRQDVARLAFNPATNIALNLALLPFLGTIGAVLGRIGGTVVTAVLRHVLIARELRAVNWLRFAVKPALISLSVGSICYSMLGPHNAAWLMLLYLTGAGLLLIIVSGLSRSAIKDMMSTPSEMR